MIQWAEYSVVLNSLICSTFFLKQECHMKGFSLTNQEVRYVDLVCVSSCNAVQSYYISGIMKIADAAEETFTLSLWESNILWRQLSSLRTDCITIIIICLANKDDLIRQIQLPILWPFKWNQLSRNSWIYLVGNTLFVSVGTTVKVHVVDLDNERVAPYVNVRPLLSSTVRDLKTLIHEVRKLLFTTDWTGPETFQFYFI